MAGPPTSLTRSREEKFTFPQVRTDTFRRLHTARQEREQEQKSAQQHEAPLIQDQARR